MNRSIFAWLLAVVCVAMMAGCEKKENPVDAASSGTYVGTFFSVIDSSAGLIVVTVESSGNVTGSVRLYDGSLTVVTISGTVANNVFSGMASDGTPITAILSNGTITGTAGVDAVFTLTQAASTVQIETFSGTYQSTSGPVESGQLIICTAGTVAWGVAIESGGTSGDHLVGVISGSSVSIQHPYDPGPVVATGTRSGNTWSGTYTGTSSGTWSITLVL